MKTPESKPKCGMIIPAKGYCKQHVCGLPATHEGFNEKDGTWKPFCDDCAAFLMRYGTYQVRKIERRA